MASSLTRACRPSLNVTKHHKTGRSSRPPVTPHEPDVAILSIKALSMAKQLVGTGFRSHRLLGGLHVGELQIVQHGDGGMTFSTRSAWDDGIPERIALNALGILPYRHIALKCLRFPSPNRGVGITFKLFVPISCRFRPGHWDAQWRLSLPSTACRGHSRFHQPRLNNHPRPSHSVKRPRPLPSLRTTTEAEEAAANWGPVPSRESSSAPSSGPYYSCGSSAHA